MSQHTRSWWRFLLVVLWMSSSAVFAQNVPSQPETVGDILSRVRQACGLVRLERHARGIRLIGDEQSFGVSTRLDFVFTPRWQAEYKVAGPSLVRSVMNGQVMRRREMGGEVRDLEFAGRAEWIGDVGVLSGLFLADGVGMPFKLSDRKAEGGNPVLVAMLEGGQTIVWVEIDRTTWRPRVYDLLCGDKATQYVLSGELMFDGIWFPEIVTRRGAELRFVKAEVARPDAATFLLERRIPTDVAFDNEADAALEARYTPGGRLLVRPRVDGKDLGWFLFDTGASSTLVEARVAADMGWAKIGESALGGIGPNVLDAGYYKASLLTVGRLTTRGPIIAVADLNLTQAMGTPVVGVLGFPTLARCVVEFDAGGRRVAVLDSRTYELPVGAWEPMRLKESMPVIQAIVERKKGLFCIDTGGHGIVINYPAVSGWKLLEGREVRDDVMQGVGGRITLKLGRVETFGMGGYLAVDVPVHFASEPSPDFMDRYTQGSIGVSILHSYVLVLDYPNDRLAVVAKKDWDAAKARQVPIPAPNTK